MKTRVFYLVLFLVALIAVVLWYFNNQDPTPRLQQNNKLQISASFYPLYFFASEIGGDKATVTNITPAGAEPHDFEPTAKQIAQIENGDMLILNGGGVEVWGERVRENLKSKKTKVVLAGEDLVTEEIEEEGKKVLDPHLWLSPKLAKEEAKRIANAYVEIDLSNREFYLKRQKELADKFDKLDEEYREGLSSCRRKEIITSHAAFGYLAKEFGLTQVTVTGVSPDEEPPPQKLAEVANFAREHNVQYIFFESLVSPKLSETIASEVGAKTMVLDPLEGISEDEVKQGANYFTKMRENLKSLQIALECTQ